MFWGKIFNAKYDIVVAICDENLLEKEITDEKLKIKISKNFYGGNLFDEKIALRMMKRATIGNVIGKDIVGLAEKNGYIRKENIILINGIPHAQFVKIQ